MSRKCFGTHQLSEGCQICKACEERNLCIEFFKSSLESSLSPASEVRYFKFGIPKVGMSSQRLDVRNPIPKKLRS